MTLRARRWPHLAVDLGVLSAAFWAAVLLRFEGPPPEPMLDRHLALWVPVVSVHYAALAAFGVPRVAWQYVGLHEVTRIAAALALASGAILALRLASAGLAGIAPVWGHLMIPIGVILIHLCLAILGLAGARALRRVLILRRRERPARAARPAERPTLLFGAGEAGRHVGRELQLHPDLGMRAVGFVDDDPQKTGLAIQGVEVLGTSDDLAAIARDTGATDLLITIARPSESEIRRICAICAEIRLRAHKVPGIAAALSRAMAPSDIREIAVEDLLRREPVEIDENVVHGGLQGRTVLVTGAGGSIGGELSRQIARFEPRALILFERAEHALFEIHRELHAHAQGTATIPVVGDVCDERRVEAVFASYRPEVIYHAAAHKHVPMMEQNPSEAIKNNVLGSRLLADAAHRHAAAVFTMISTDKAVNPSSVMGASKRVAELCVQALAPTSDTRFLTVRFGNVLGSAGSVIPLFKQQLLRGGPLTVTHPEMRRYFMTIPEASRLVLQASIMGEGGEIFILDMGDPVKIADLARDMIRLSGLVPDEDVRIEYSGLRPGEKLFEEIHVSGKNPKVTRHPKIFTGRGRPRDLGEIDAAVKRLAARALESDAAGVRRALADLLPEYQPADVERLRHPSAPPAPVTEAGEDEVEAKTA